MINEQQIQEEFEKAFKEALAIYGIVKGKNYPPLNIFIQERVWESLVKYERMEITTKEKFFEELYKKTPLEEYTKGLEALWGNVDHSYMTKGIEELNKMVIQKDFRDAELYGNKKLTTRSIKLQNTWQEYELKNQEKYPLNPARDFKTVEQRYVNRHKKLYKNLLNRVEKSNDIVKTLTDFMKKYDELDKTIPYFSHSTGQIIRHVDVATYNSMLYNVNLTRSAWNRSNYDAMLLGNDLWYLPAHPFACPMCARYQGRVYSEHGGVYPKKEDAIKGGVGHPNCKHVWVSYWSPEQVQREKYNSSEWEEKYKTKQKIQSLDLKKSRLLADRRIYNNLGQQDLVDKTTSKIKRIREQKKELEKSL